MSEADFVKLQPDVAGDAAAVGAAPAVPVSAQPGGTSGSAPAHGGVASQAADTPASSSAHILVCVHNHSRAHGRTRCNVHAGPHEAGALAGIYERARVKGPGTAATAPTVARAHQYDVMHGIPDSMKIPVW